MVYSWNYRTNSVAFCPKSKNFPPLNYLAPVKLFSNFTCHHLITHTNLLNVLWKYPLLRVLHGNERIGANFRASLCYHGKQETWVSLLWLIVFLIFWLCVRLCLLYGWVWYFNGSPTKFHQLPVSVSQNTLRSSTTDIHFGSLMHLSFNFSWVPCLLYTSPSPRDA